MEKLSSQLLDLLTAFFQTYPPVYFKKGEIILRPDRIPSGVYCIENGYVKVYFLSEQGDERLHIIYKKEDIFPLIWAFKNTTKEVFYEALTDITLRMVPKEKFLNFIKQKPLLLLILIERLIDIFDIHVNRVRNLEITSSYPRLISRLLFLSARFGKKVKNQMIIDLPLTHKEIASSINMTRETVSRECQKLVKKGLIRQKNHLIIIPDLEKLEKETALHYERVL